MNPEGRAILPGIAFRSFVQRFQEPKLEEGFRDITTVDFHFKGTPEQQALWSKYWVSKFAT
jgi:bifunctional polynucleotide phosphatase/kinase